ncbi:MAG: energy-coupling factor ABC transporter substrate-binding protein [Nostoc sp.]
MSQSKKGLSNWLLVVAVLALAVAPLIFVRGGEFAGSDDKAEIAITEIQPGYKPWFKSFFEPASGEIESLLFASQAALGAGVVGFAIGLYKGRSQQQKRKE